MAQLRALIAEDQALLRVGLTRILESDGIEVVDAVQDAATLAAALAKDDFDVAILDVRLPPTFTTEGLTAATMARAARPALPVLVLSQHVEPLYARDLLADGQGSVGYLLKDRVADVDGFLAAVRQVSAGGTVLDPEVVAGLLTSRPDPVDRLTDREREVLTLMAQGRSNAAISARLHVSEGAVTKHIASIFTKLDLPQAPDDNRRVLAVLAWLDGAGG
ncbi:DNA-binding response regulator, NarL/FixJ family, contains REC and HTH domains [Jiangella alkaliphila]|uniref:DNA-binding response regulator, NarL/FixJ family, contains REC and HTH domains n=1 Tax=Jiangella alkaliphila TaxID=419479 RepID=A0A1H2L8S4_9ACTN|nr:response regulator transcription factor [Jiangella alkaliphila]SDU77339.1 DNA-binding response regulator, NarL/FixJ family, contains REC and HTH domains [Jiangella alkaliphila]